MGEDCDADDEFSILTNKSVKRLPGNTVWLVAGKGRNPRRYFLCEVFVVDQVGLADVERFKFFASGHNGYAFRPLFALDEEPWFPEFRERMQRFSLGLRELPSEFIPRFRRLTPGWPG
jgi:hypothetical protein